MKYFKPEEYTMGGEPCFEKMDKDHLEEQDELREAFGHPMIPTSSYRSEAYNNELYRKLGKKPVKSQHLLGTATDYKNIYTSAQLHKLVSLATERKMSIGISKHFIHIDTRIGEEKLWVY